MFFIAFFTGCSKNEFFDSPHFSFISQQETKNYDFYYYQGKEIPLKKSAKSYFVFKNKNTNNEVSYITTYTNKSFTSQTKIPTCSSKEALQLVKVDTTSKYSRSTNVIQDSTVIYSSPTYIMQNGTEVTASPYIYIKLKNLSDTLLLKEYTKENSLTITRQMPFMPLWYEISCLNNKDFTSVELANKFYQLGLFSCSTPDFIGDKKLTFNDTFYPDQWGLKNNGQYEGKNGIDISYEDALTLADGYGVKVGIIDYGVDYSHPDLSTSSISYDAYTGEVAKGSSKIYMIKNQEANSAHGTACAGIINSNLNNIGTCGVAPKSTIVSICQPLELATTSVMANGINWAVNNNIDILSCSWESYPNDLLTEAINNAAKKGRNGKGCVIVFSSGNDNRNSLSYPSSLNSVISVGAIDMFGNRKSENCLYENFWGSNYGTGLSVVAPGIRIATTDITGTNGYNSGRTTHDTLGLIDYNDNNYTNCFNGTSAATPFVAGIAALILEKQPSLTSSEVKSIIQSTCYKLPTYFKSNSQSLTDGTWNAEVGYGLVNAFNAVAKAINIKSNYKIQGETCITKNGNTFLFTNVPAGAYVSWNVSDTRYFTVIQTSYNTAIVRATTSEKSTILTGTLMNAQGTKITSLSLSIKSEF